MSDLWPAAAEFGDLVAVLLSEGFDDFLDEAFGLFDGAADVFHGVHDAFPVEFVGERPAAGGGPEVLVCLQAIEEVIVETFLLHAHPRGLRVLADQFVVVLPVSSKLHAGHEDVLGGHEGEFGHEVLAHHRLVDDEARRHVVHEVERAIEGEEGLGEREAAVG